MWQVVCENPRAVIYAVVMHLVLLILLIVSLDWTPSVTKTGGAQPIEARLVDNSQLKAIEDRKLAEQAAIKKAEAARKRKLEQAVKKKAVAERKRKADLAARKKAEVARKLKEKQAVKKKAEAEHKRKIEQAARKKAAAARKHKAEQLAKQKAEVERQHRADVVAKQKAEAARALQAEIDAEQHEQEQGVVDEYVGYIRDKVTSNWLQPAGSSDGLSCVVRVGLIPGGDVATARVVQSSGDLIFDRSVEAAVFKAAPLPVPRDSNLFHYFRELNFVFRPG